MAGLRRALRSRARSWARRLPPPVRRRLRQLGRRPGSPPVPHGPALSVVVAMGTDAAGFALGLASVLASTLTDLEVIVAVPDDRPSDDVAVLAPEVGQDPRVRWVRHRGQTLGAGWNAGAKVARGRFLAFLSPVDTVPATAYATLVGSLRRSGSDFACGTLTRQIVGRPRDRERPDEAHDLDRRAVRLSDVPAAIADLRLGSRVFRASFWAATAGFDEAAGQEGTAVVAATLSAKTFDLFQAVTCVQQSRREPRPTEAAAREAFTQSLRGLEAANRVVTARGDRAVRAAWVAGMLDGELADLLATIQLADAATRTELSAAAARLVEGTDEQVWTKVRLDRKLRLWLAAAARWNELDLLVQHFRLYGETPETEVRDGRIFARRDRLPELHGAAEDLLELSRSQTELRGCIERVSWRGDQLEVSGWGFIRGLDLSVYPPQLSARWVDALTGDALGCPIRQVSRPAASRWAKLRYHDVAAGGFDLSIDRSDLPNRAAKWVLEVTVVAGGVRRSGPIPAVSSRGVGRGMPASDLRSDDDPFRAVPQLDPQLGFLVQIRQERVRAAGLRVEGHRAGGQLRALDDKLARLVSVLAISDTGELTAELGRPDADGRQPFELDLSEPAHAQGWEFRAVDAQQRRHRVSWPLDSRRDGRVITANGTGWVRSNRGFCRLVADHPVLEAVGVEVTENRLAVVVRLVGAERATPPVATARARLVGALAEVPVVDVEPAGDDRLRLVFALRAGRWGGPPLPLPTGDYQIMIGTRAVTCAGELLGTLPSDGLVTSHAYEVGRMGLDDRVVIWLGPPRPLAETSLVARERVGQWYQQLEVAPTDAVLFQCYRGDFVTDSQLALHRELHRRGTELELLWSIRDLSVPVPEGGRGLLIESREWYEALASTRYLCTNVDFERSFRRRPHQQYLQTFHGYPFKSMGATMWRAQGRAESVIAVERERRGSAWTAIVVPAEFCVEFYRHEYGFSGDALVTGYPRDDSLSAPDIAEVRARVRAQLNVTEGQTVVLYAPTWRDTTATSAWTAQLFDELDLDALAAQLGSGYAVWLRAHNYNLRGGLHATSASVTDVSGYPEINDLILAADVAVLDYSSLRFDWLVTEKPVIFFVPDLDDYLHTRGVLYDYGPTAPGPQLRTTTDVGAALLDLETVTARYAAARRTFNEKFNTLNDGRATERVVDAFFR